jgi:nucleoside-diphosphate-sugar epimerase
MDKILITGASGLIGHEVIETLQGHWSIYAVSRRPYEHLSQNTRMIHCDLAKECDFSSFPKHIDAVVHLAQSEHFREFPEMAEDIFGVNTLATLRPLEYARLAGAKTFVYASSGGIYGYGDEGFRRDQPIVTQKDLGFYQSTKLCRRSLQRTMLPT